jgi:sigma-B regulation protein RsbU (phosphoserine phosphatase)
LLQRDKAAEPQHHQVQIVQNPNRILIVDDERLNINVLADLLKTSYRISAAINGQQALKLAHSDDPPDLILLDVMMPEIDGYEVCRQLKADEATRDIPIIFVTAMGQESDETKGLALGAADYITKPISPAIVEARVRTQIERKKHLEALQRAHAVINAQKERMQEELNVGRDIQLSMLPRTFPAFPERSEFKLHASMEAAREVGGDFYDFFFVDEDHLCLCVGDVSGKGVPASLFMAISKVLIRLGAGAELSTASILTRVNDELAANNDAMMFVTVFLGVLDVRSGELTYTNAGHNPPYIKRCDGDVERLPARHGPMLGPKAGVTFKEGQVHLAAGELLFLFSDGITEARDNDGGFYGEARLESLLENLDASDPETLAQRVRSDIDTFAMGAEQADDITMLALAFQGIPGAGKSQVFTMTIANDLDRVGDVLQAFDTFAQETGLPPAATQKVKLAFDELLNNSISYGFPHGGEHELEVGVEVLNDRLKVQVVDDGIPFNPFLRVMPDLGSTLAQRQIGGVGIHLVRELMDEVAYKRGVGKNIVTLTKRLDC